MGKDIIKSRDPDSFSHEQLYDISIARIVLCFSVREWHCFCNIGRLVLSPSRISAFSLIFAIYMYWSMAVVFRNVCIVTGIDWNCPVDHRFMQYFLDNIQAMLIKLLEIITCNISQELNWKIWVMFNSEEIMTVLVTYCMCVLYLES